MQTHRDLEFGDGTYRFMLTMAGILAIEEKCKSRIGAIHRHLLAGRYTKDNVDFGYSLEGDYGAVELLEICRQGLIGGNSGFVDGRDITVSDHLATHLVRTYLHPENGRPIIKAWDIATAIVQACVIGYEPEGDVKKKKLPRKPKATAVS
ncbi:gene transfer agent family protein [Sphingobium sp. AR-3-1]|uniref:Gene transfer agent family protein n=1 Tax=Sphingobium psychrophilum TaxID=2728834 RepID=A0A7X9ZUF9_9SPHN|nr:gene transfer agent family protein [Sphingobium psychrophilum]NML11304.1 gene transfer agent family protein [Sphingobium psychrophilum]